MLRSYLNMWTYKRLIQLIVGIYFLWNYTEDGGTFSALFGGIMTFQALLNVGCFSTRGCTTPQDSDQTKPEDFASQIKNVKLK